MSAATDEPPLLSIPALSIIVVTWNCRDLALRCLHDIHASQIGRSFEVIVVDNASADATVAAIAAAYPTTRLIANTANLGYARANNQAIAIAAGRDLLLLNPDAFPTSPATFAALLAALDAHPEFAAMGCRLVHPDGRHQVGDAGWRPSPAHVVVHALGLAHVLPGAHGLFLVRPPRHAAPIDVDWICGACLLVRAEAARRHGGMDEGFFMYAEDVAFGCRLRDAGLRLGYLPGQAVLHIQGGTRADAGPSTGWLDSLARLYAAMNGGRHWFTFRAAMGAGFLLRAGAYRVLALRHGPSMLLRARAMAAFARHAWRLQLP